MHRMRQRLSERVAVSVDARQKQLEALRSRVRRTGWFSFLSGYLLCSHLCLLLAGPVSPALPHRACAACAIADVASAARPGASDMAASACCGIVGPVGCYGRGSQLRTRAACRSA